MKFERSFFEGALRPIKENDEYHDHISLKSDKKGHQYILYFMSFPMVLRTQD